MNILSPHGTARVLPHLTAAMLSSVFSPFFDEQAEGRVAAEKVAATAVADKEAAAAAAVEAREAAAEAAAEAAEALASLEKASAQAAEASAAEIADAKEQITKQASKTKRGGGPWRPHPETRP